MIHTNRRDILRLGSASVACPLLAALHFGSTASEGGTPDAASSKNTTSTGAAMKIQYLEIVTPEVTGVCATYEQVHGLKFSEPDMSLGNARTAELPTGGLLGVRAPLRETEEPIVRPYFLVDDIEAAVAKAAGAGAKIALPPMELPGHGTCAIFIQGGAEHGLWQL